MTDEKRVAKPVGYDDEIVLVDGATPVRRDWAESKDWIDVEAQE
jgi:hypothetical protein